MQQPLFNESFSDALTDIVKALGGTKKVGEMLRPEKLSDEAGRWVSDCLNPAMRDKFDLDHVLWLLREGRKINCHAGMNYLCYDAGYAPAQPIELQDQFAELQRELIKATQEISRMASRIERIASIKG